MRPLIKRVKTCAYKGAQREKRAEMAKGILRGMARRKWGAAAIWRTRESWFAALGTGLIRKTTGRVESQATKRERLCCETN